ncbi:unnamed protein product [Bursaphelenchus okinawaensis]|uniref:Sugar transporter SWEET n=1 Tax=Bursaphelenchus okinawaensis TaxID=465554 RepID=A0A811KMY0_9BILA|nr:unnamed protein product [Bursaphelenchus okinawaensis]CAG9105539.1 unnamed protein product [Bursaphelenchus okinawaensis]
MDGWVSLLSFTATSSTFALFLCGLQICQRIKLRGHTDGTSVAPFLLTAISCIVWTGYGEVRQDSTVIMVNGVGLVVQSVYLAYYYHKTRLRTRLNRLLILELIIAVLTYYWLYSDITHETKENFLGIICMMLNIATIGAPLLDVGQVIRNKSTESLPFMLCLGNMIVSIQWLAYGILTDDFYMKVPNSVAVVIAAVQLSLFVIYPSNHRVVSQKSEEDRMHLI